MIGYGNSLDGYKITSADPTGKGMKAVVDMAIKMSGINSSEIDYVNLHGTGTRLNDELELSSFMSVVGDGGKDISVSSTKSRHGHAIAAAGIQEFNLLCKCMEENFVPGTSNLENPVVETGIDLPKENKEKQLNIGMTNNFAFGGVNTSLIIKKI
jgi:3-oxoacyl-[acyl-carrier-protein] synthase II